MNPELAAVYTKAAGLIRTDGLNKGGFRSFRGPAGTIAVLDTLGSISQVITGNPVPPSELGDCPELYREAVEFLSGRIPSPVIDSDPEERIADWNDEPDRTVDEVVAALESAARDVEDAQVVDVQVVPVITMRPLGDVEMDELVRVEAEFQRRAVTLRPWSTPEYLARVSAVHARFEHMRRYQSKPAGRAS